MVNTKLIQPRRAIALGRVSLVLWTLLAGAGCMKQTVVHDGWGWLRDNQWADKPKTATDKAAAVPTSPGWAIQLANFDGRDRHRQAKSLARLAQSHSRMAEIWIEDVNIDGKSARTRVLAGRYRSPEDWGAIEDLNHLRFVQIGDDLPFASAELIPLGATDADGTPADAYDLKRYVGMFSLQVGFFDDAAGPEFRAFAEQTVKDLRAKGEQAYYYHGPHRSLICIGLFTEADFDEDNGTRIYGPRIRDLQARHPHNFANGYTQIEKVQGQSIGEQPSFLVRIF